MHISEIHIENSKSFCDFNIKLNGGLNIIVGTNGVGKSNFLHLIKQGIYDIDTKTNKKINIKINLSDRESNIIAKILAYKTLLYLKNFRNIYLCDNRRLADKLIENCKIENIEKKSGANSLYLNIQNEKNMVIEMGECISGDCYVCDNENEYSTCMANMGEYINSMSTKILNRDKHKDLYEQLEKLKKICIFDMQIILDHARQFEEQNKNFVNREQNDDFHNISTFFKDIGFEYSLGKIDDFGSFKVESLIKYLYKSVHYIDGIIDNSGINNYKNFSKSVLGIDEYNFNEKLYDYIKIENTNQFIDGYIKEINCLAKMKNNNEKSFASIKDFFYQITGKNFDIKCKDDIYIQELIESRIRKIGLQCDENYVKKQVQNYIKNEKKTILSANLVICGEDKMYPCSYGEKELIIFLTMYFSKDKRILLIDEPCSHLGPQYKHKLMKLLFENNSTIDKQILMVTHDAELISEDNCKNIIRFKLSKGLTKYDCLKDKDNQILKTIYELKQILFYDKCLFVEGYHDYRLMKQFLKFHETRDKKLCSNWHVIPLGGCGNGNKISGLMNEFNILYKIIYDSDNIFRIKGTLAIPLLSNMNRIFVSNPNVYFNDVHNKINSITRSKLICKDEFEKYIANAKDHKLYAVYSFIHYLDEKEKQNNFVKLKQVTYETYFMEQSCADKPTKYNGNSHSGCLKSAFGDNKVNIEDYLNYIIDKYGEDENIQIFCNMITEKFMSAINIGDLLSVFANIGDNQIELKYDENVMDKIIENLNNGQQNIYFWNSKIKHAEGIGKIIFGEKCFSKNRWDKCTNENIHKIIGDHYNKCQRENIPYEFNELLSFLSRY